MEVSLKVGCLPYAVGKQPSIPLINLGRKRTLNDDDEDDDDDDNLNSNYGEAPQFL